MKDYSEKLIESRTLDNGITVSIFDLGKQVAADRWYIKILCRLELPVADDRLSAAGLHGPELEAFRQRFNGVLVHEFAKERHFVDDRLKDEVIAELVATLNRNSMNYVANPVFADNLVQQKVEMVKQELKVRQGLDMVEHDMDDDEGPADFSACFRD